MAKPGISPSAWLPLVILPLVVGWTARPLPGWIYMWLLAGSVFAGCKWLVLADAVRRGVCGSVGPRMEFLLGWPGMDAVTFLSDVVPSRAPGSEWFMAVGKLCTGLLLYFVVARRAGGELSQGWIGMIGIIFILHFGGFHLLALAWRSCGVPAQPIMRNPVSATSLGEFWGRRWNVAFNDIAERFVFRPLVRRVGAAWANLAAFGFSGLLHDLVISVPARGGYGLPTLYFLLQGCGVLFERSGTGRRLGLRRGWRGWIFTMVVTAGPAFWLFHPAFVRHIIVPMMKGTCAL